MSFGSFALDPQLVRATGEMGFTTPTAIQRDTIPALLAGRDVLACAVTGSGKTAAFLLPILHRLSRSPGRATRALILAPTRELAAQIDDHRQQLARHVAVGGAAIVGGVAMAPQEQALRRGADVLVATPGRLLDHLRAPQARLGAVEVLVLDEADRMLDMGFLPDIRRVLAHLPASRQTLLFSATMPDAIVALARAILRDPIVVNIGRPPAAAAGVSQLAYPVATERKSALLAELLRGPGVRRVLAFTRTKHRADRLARFLEGRGVAADRIHGNRTQAQRTAALSRLRNGQLHVLVATDVAARGLDVEGLSHVVNFDVPVEPEAYVHRIGRTGRAAARGDAFTLVSPEEEASLRAIERSLGRPIDRATLPGFDYRAAAVERAPARRIASPPWAVAAPRGQSGRPLRGASRPWGPGSVRRGGSASTPQVPSPS